MFSNLRRASFFTLSSCLAMLAMIVVSSGQTRYSASQGSETGANRNATHDPEIQRLEPGKPIEREISGTQIHCYEITLKDGECLDAAIDQRGVDVVVSVFGPAGNRIVDMIARTAPLESSQSS